MPTYSYACTACDHRFDVQQGFADDPLTQCPQCSARLRKLFGSVGVVFKGSGFYRTDARADRRGRTPSTAGKNGARGDSPAAPAAAAASDSTSASSATPAAGTSSGTPSGGTSGNGSTAVPARAAAD